VVGRSVRDLLTDDEFQGVVATVLGNNADMATATAEQITEEGPKFLVACSEFPEAHLRPSQIVDEGWHALILHTRLYATLCEKLAGRFVHHLPERRDPTRCNPGALRDTQAFIERAGFRPAAELWLRMEDTGIRVAAECSHSCGSSCSDSCSNTGPN
jgi:hypothetical protein